MDVGDMSKHIMSPKGLRIHPWLASLTIRLDQGLTHDSGAKDPIIDIVHGMSVREAIHVQNRHVLPIDNLS